MINFSMKLLIVEDEKEIAIFLKKGLEAERFSVDVAHDGESGENMARMNDYDIVILDHNLPYKNGITICKTLRELGKTYPIIMLTAEHEIHSKVEALTSGANDYVTKPFAFEELVARIRVLLRNVPENVGSTLRHKDLEIDIKKFTAQRSDKPLELRKKEFALLEYFMRNPESILTRNMILEHVWDTNADPFTNTVEVHIRTLRNKINNGENEKFIETIRGIGYRL